jgi:phage terminase large subunit-like protein
MDLSHINSSHFDTAVRYAEDIASKKVLANVDRVLACKRFLADLERDDLEFRSDQFDFVIDLIEGTIHHVQGEDKNGVSFKGTPMLLTDWQKFVCVNLFGFFRKGTDIRRFNEALIFCQENREKHLLVLRLQKQKAFWTEGLEQRHILLQTL